MYDNFFLSKLYKNEEFRVLFGGGGGGVSLGSVIISRVLATPYMEVTLTLLSNTTSTIKCWDFW